MCYEECKSDKSQLTESFPSFEKAKKMLSLPYELCVMKKIGKAKSELTHYKLRIPEPWQNILLPFLFL